MAKQMGKPSKSTKKVALKVAAKRSRVASGKIKTSSIRVVASPYSDEARHLLVQAGKALSKPGLSKSVVFRDSSSGIFAYSIDPTNPARVIRESSDGTRRVGRMVNGRFRAA